MSISDIISLFGFLIAICALILESRMTRLALYTQAILDLNKEFYAGKMYSLRVSAAKKILTKKKANRDLSDILDFFTDIAILAERGALDKKLAYDLFSYWMIYYWEISQNVINSARKNDPESWLVLERLVKKVSKEQCLDLSPDAITSFLKEEADIED